MNQRKLWLLLICIISSFSTFQVSTEKSIITKEILKTILQSIRAPRYDADENTIVPNPYVINEAYLLGLISSALNATTSATAEDVPNTIVKRDASGNFATNMITLDGTVTYATDAATKGYVDVTVAAGGIVAKDPARVLSTTDITLSGLQTIDTVNLLANDRVLLVGQTNPIENGLWLAQVGAWTRPADFASGTEPGAAYVLISDGATYKGSGWLCNTPEAIINTDPIYFALFSTPGQTTAANVGTGPGHVFINKTGITLNLRNLKAGDTHVSVADNANDITIATDATSANTPDYIVARDASGDFAANIITADLSGNADTATFATAAGTADTATDFIGLLDGDVQGPQTNTSVVLVGGQSATDVAAATLEVQNATDANTPNTLVKRNALGDFTANDIIANLVGNADTATFATTAGTADTATDFIGLLDGDVQGPQTNTSVVLVGGQSATDVAAATLEVQNATDANTPDTLVKRDVNGDFTAHEIIADLIGDVTGSATTFTGSLAGDVTGTQSATVVALVDGKSAADVASATTDVQNATDANTPNTLVKRDANGDFTAHEIIADLIGDVTGSATTFTGSLAGDVTGTQSATVVSKVGALGTGVVHSNASGVLSSSLIVNADVAASAAIVDTKLATISTTGKVLNSATTATSTNTANAIVARDGSGNFATNKITISGTITNATDAATKDYVDTAVTTGLIAKDPAVVVSTTDVAALSGLQTIDGVLLVDSDRVLLVGQTDPIENGLWVAHVGAWTRPADFDTGDAAGGAYVLIMEGATQAGSSWLCSTPAAVIDTDPIEFAQFTTPGQTTAANVGTGTGEVFRDKTGVTLNLKTIKAGTHITVTNNADDITLTTDATDTNTVSTIVARDASGDFSAGTITAETGLTVSAGVLQLPTGAVGTPALNFGDATSGLYRSALNELSFSTAGAQRLVIAAAGSVAVKNLTSAGVVHNDASGVLSSSLVTNADIANNSISGGKLTNNTVADAKLQTISTAGKVANSATTATTANNPDTIVLRDGSGDYAATLNVLKAGDTMTGDLILSGASTQLQLPNGTVSAPALRFADADTGLYSNGTNVRVAVNGNENFIVGNAVVVNNVPVWLTSGTAADPAITFNGDTNTGLYRPAADTVGITAGGASRMQIKSGAGSVTINEFGTAGVVHNNASGVLSSSLVTNADIANNSISGGKLTNNTVADAKLQTISTAGKVANSATTATSANNIDTIVLRDGSGNFSAGTITANLNGNATTATTAGSYSGSLSGDVTGTLPATVVSSVGGQTAANVAAGTLLANQAVSTNIANRIVKRDASGNFSAGTITANLTGSVTGAASLNVLKSGDTMTGTLRLPNGAVGAPALRFADPNTGLFADGANVVTTVNGIEIFRIAQGSITANREIIFPTQNAGAPSITFSGDVNTGIYHPAADTVGISTGGTNRLSIANAKITSNEPILLPVGVAGTPSLTFTGDEDTGIYSPGANTLAFSTGGIQRAVITSAGAFAVKNLTSAGVVHNGTTGILSSSLITNTDIANNTISGAKLTNNTVADAKLQTISTAGKVANSATTATNANTASAIVARDASGDFAANRITIGNGTAALPSLTFSETDTGIYHVTANTLGFATNGTKQLTISASYIKPEIPILIPDGTVAAPSLSFSSEGTPNTGIYHPSANNMVLGAAGVEKLRVSNAGVTVSDQFIRTDVLCDQAIHQDLLSSGTSPLSLPAQTSVAILRVVGIGNTVRLPSGPINGQFVTIMLRSTSDAGNLTIGVAGGVTGESVFPTTITLNKGGTSYMTFFYYATDNLWYALLP